ncbi:MAG: GSCFA domain-containing protein [Flavobacteriales bacterium]
MKLQTQIPLTSQDHPIDYSSKVLLLGSCFVENMGSKLDYFKFNILQNPFGVLFQPIAIEKLLTRAILNIPFTEDDIFFYREQWHCFEVHSSFSNTDKTVFLEELNSKMIQLFNYVQEVTHIVLTYGTSWVYRHIKTNKLVANCHKLPQQEFVKELLLVSQIEASLLNTIGFIKKINPEVVFINTVSPVRHIKDGFVENTRSKAHLITALHQIINQQSSKPNFKFYYFPAYEIMMDELRDYRFYKEDLLHPNQTAIQIIWEAFSKVWISSETNNFQKEIEIIKKGLQHKPFRVESEEHQLFLKNLQQKIKNLQQKIPTISFDD